MAVKVAINGFGRIGRLAFRQMFDAEGYEVVAINDLTDADMLAYLLKYDTTQGRYALCDKVSNTENSIIVDGTEITIYKEADAKNLPWGELDIDDLLESVYILSMDRQILCREDCKGLCPRCGADLNEGACGCGKESDPRLAVLEQLLDDID
mgnify:CR=1 FL=1